MTPVSAGRRLPPWTIIVPQVIWALAIYGFVYTALNLQSWSDWMMAALSFTLVVGLYFRSRIAFWLSALGFAATIGGNLALIEASRSLPAKVLINMAVAVGTLLLHQMAHSLRWFGFRDARQIRRIFWGLCILVVALMEMIIPLRPR
jgi:hypothetical protein